MTAAKVRRLTRRRLMAGAAALAGLTAVAGLALQPRPAPEATFRLIDGRQLRLADLRGRPVAVSFWATTCLTCVAETPALASVYAEFASGGLELIAVAMPYDPPYRVVDFARQSGLPYPVALDIDASVSRAFGDVRYTPTLFLIDPEGRIAERFEGAGIPATLREHLRKWQPAAATTG